MRVDFVTCYNMLLIICFPIILESTFDVSSKNRFRFSEWGPDDLNTIQRLRSLQCRLRNLRSQVPGYRTMRVNWNENNFVIWCWKNNQKTGAKRVMIWEREIKKMKMKTIVTFAGLISQSFQYWCFILYLQTLFHSQLFNALHALHF